MLALVDQVAEHLLHAAKVGQLQRDLLQPMAAGSRLPGTPEPLHRWQGSDGIGIAADAWGNPEDPLVLLQHGGGQTRHAWKGTGEALEAAGYYAVAFDARGHGDSDWAPDGQYGQDVMVQDLKCVIATIGQYRPVLVGASIGGGTSLVAVGEGHVNASALIRGLQFTERSCRGNQQLSTSAGPPQKPGRSGKKRALGQ